jgi:hypothetical protein
MNSGYLRRAFLLGTALGLGLTGWAHAAVELTPFRLEETRSVALVKDHIGHSPDELKVIFTLKGPEVDSAVRYGHLHLDEAVDDKGTNLIPPKDSFDEAGKLKKFDNDFFRKSDLEAKRPADDPQVSVVLALPKRSATKIARLRGSIDLVQQGDIKTVELAGLKPGDSQKMPIPAEAGIGITATVKAGDDSRSIDLAMSGDENALDSIEVLDASGKKVSNGISSFTLGKISKKSIDLEKPWDASMKLVAKVAMGRKTIKAPFDMKDIALP